MLEKKYFIDQIEVVENGSVQVRTRTSIFENEQEISRTYHRHVILPGDDYSSEESRVQVICSATHTEDVVAKYQTTQSMKRI